ncbi:MAG: DNA/RNA non-specific endonuclease [Pseudomonadota bacterium]|nr:DNA/RNA non-specific endonuclease [Pseudomonadota bacterium]
MKEGDPAVLRLADMRSPSDLPGAVSDQRSGEGAPESLERQHLHDEAFFRDRQGFDEAFLHDFPVPMPRCVGRTAGDQAPLKMDGGHELRYSNFSVVMSMSRRIALYTACNIDGGTSQKIKRDADAWYYDDRIDRAHQAGDELYRDNELDRGHLVRRQDPVWGSQAALANDDTFHFTNCSPQQSGMNQKTWRGLEDYFLQNARVHSLRISVFTGPVLRDDDMVYRGVKIPKEYWKVVAFRTDDRPSATAYLISQGKLIEDLREFVFGRYKTYQVAVAEVQELAGLDFGELSRFDAFSNENALEGRRWRREELRSWEAIRI